MGGVKNWDKFKLLMWKNWVLTKRKKFQSVAELLIPVIICALIGCMLSDSTDPTDERKDYDPTSIDEYFEFDQNNEVYYCPKNSQFSEIMRIVKKSMNLNKTLGFGTEKELLFNIKNRQPLAGVVFKPGTNKTNLDFDIKFPSQLRYDSGTWDTDKIFRPGDEVSDDLSPGYIPEGFIALQSAISMAFMKSHIDENITDIVVQRYPTLYDKSNYLMPVLNFILSLTILFSFLYSFLNSVKVIIMEKESQLKEMMKIMGLQNWLHWAAWFTKSMIFSSISVTIIIIQWTNLIWTKSDGSAVWFFLFVYSISIITYSFFIGSFFSKSNRASLLGTLLWFASFVPYSMNTSKMQSQSIGVLLLLCLCNNSALSYGITIIVQLECKSHGLQWSNFFTPTILNETLSIGHITIMLIFDSVLYSLFALYLERVIPGEFGVAEKWYFPIESFIPKRKKTEYPDIIHSVTQALHYESHPTDKTAGIQIRGLRKVYKKKTVAVQELTINMYNDEVTILLGNNGAGKTTTMSMLTGMIPPTSGTALVNGYDIRTNLSEVRESIGLCTQHNILFDNLTIREHIIFYSRLKGLSPLEAELEVGKYTSQLDLMPKTNSQSKTLSGGMKRKLCMAIAFCGKAKIIICDEPTSGMDPVARRTFWDLLKKEKTGRTILLSTHFMDEADILGDRIAIMQNGELKCYGSSMFLKNTFGRGYELICEKSKHCNVKATTDLIKQYIPDIDINSNIGSELSYKLDKNYSYLFGHLLEDLENTMTDLGILGFGISLTTLEDVFLKVSSDMFRNLNTDENFDQIGLETAMPNSSDSISNYTLQTGSNLIWYQIKAMVFKKALFTWRNIFITICHMLLPLTFTIVMFSSQSTVPDFNTPALPIVLGDYTKNPLALISPYSKGLNKTYVEILSNAKVPWELKFVDSVEDHISNMTETEYIDFCSRSWISLTENSSLITAWFSAEGYHTMPLSLNSVFNALLKRNCPTCSISVTNSPFKYKDKSIPTNNIVEHMIFNEFLIIVISFATFLVSAFFILSYIKERTTRFKLLQFVSGINIWVFWLTSFIWDYLIFFTSIALMLIFMSIYQLEDWSSGPELALLLIFFMCFIWCILPFIYIFSAVFKSPSGAYNKVVLLAIVSSLVPFVVIGMMNDSQVALHIFLMIPYYALVKGLQNLNDLMSDEQSYKNVNYFAWNSPGLGANITYFLISGILYFVIIFLNEFNVLRRIVVKFRKEETLYIPSADEMDNDVLKENYRIRNLTNDEIKSNNLIIKNMSKCYKNHLAVHELCVGVEEGMCFGLLGVNGAGKTSTFKMLTGDESITSGDAWVQGISLKSNLKEVYKNIGYCPQFDALLDEFTGRETLKLFCLIRGVPSDQIPAVSTKLSKDLNFTQHIDKRTKEYSGGNKRKLSTALSMIGNPSVVYLDEPTTGLDPRAKRELWKVVSKYRDAGKSIILTSHSMEECEALCTRLAIMVNGEFKCLGSVQHLKNKFSKGFLLLVQLKRSSNPSPIDSEYVKIFVEQLLCGSVLKEEYQGRLSYHIPFANQKWSQMFGQMEAAKLSLNIESYSLSQTNLEQIFISLISQQL